MRNKYLEEIGIHSYPENNYGGIHHFSDIKHFLRARRVKRKTGVDPRIAWDIEGNLYMWLYSNICQLKNDTIADLEWRKYTHRNKEYTEGQYIDYLLDLLIKILNFDDTKNLPKLSSEITKNEDDIFTSICTSSKEEREEFLKIWEANLNELKILKDEMWEVLRELLPSLWW